MNENLYTHANWLQREGGRQQEREREKERWLYREPETDRPHDKLAAAATAANVTTATIIGTAPATQLHWWKAATKQANKQLQPERYGYKSSYSLQALLQLIRLDLNLDTSVSAATLFSLSIALSLCCHLSLCFALKCLFSLYPVNTYIQPMACGVIKFIFNKQIDWSSFKNLNELRIYKCESYEIWYGDFSVLYNTNEL